MQGNCSTPPSPPTGASRVSSLQKKRQPSKHTPALVESPLETSSSSMSESGPHSTRKPVRKDFSLDFFHGHRIVSRRGGPILFTAPHGINLYRAGCEMHVREMYTTEIANLLREEIGCELASSITWNTIRIKPGGIPERCNKDPNYLQMKEFKGNHWNAAIRKHARAFTDHICLNIDLHGKENPKTERKSRLDVGLAPMLRLWRSERDQAFIYRLKASLEEELEGKVFEGTEFRFTLNPHLSGYWRPSKDRHTISEQCVRYKIPALQLEMTGIMREAFVKDKALRSRLAKAIVKIYKEVIVPHRHPDGCEALCKDTDTGYCRGSGVWGEAFRKVKRPPLEEQRKQTSGRVKPKIVLES